MTPQRLHADASQSSFVGACQAYLLGALHDGTCSDLHHTHRFSQKGTDWLLRLKDLLSAIGHRSWLYREGSDREVFILETSADFLDTAYDPDLFFTLDEQLAYVRGYFDAEGGLPQSPNARFYVQFCQKNLVELHKVKVILSTFGIECGKVHNPSTQVDPNYWRFYVRTKSHQDFIVTVGSWHPRKERLLVERMMI